MIYTLSKILGNTQKTVSNWKKEKRPIMELLYKYFTKEELEEFLKTGKILKLEFVSDMSLMYNQISKKLHNNLIKFLGKNYSSEELDICFNKIDYIISQNGQKITQLEMIKFLIDKDNKLNLDEETRAAYISSVSILNDLEFELFKREAYCIYR